MFHIPSYACCSLLFRWLLLVCYRGRCILSYLLFFVISVLYVPDTMPTTVSWVYLCFQAVQLLILIWRQSLKPCSCKAEDQADDCFSKQKLSEQVPLSILICYHCLWHTCDNCSFEVQVLLLESLHNLLARYWLKYQDIMSTDNFLSIFMFSKIHAL